MTRSRRRDGQLGPRRIAVRLRELDDALAFSLFGRSANESYVLHFTEWPLRVIPMQYSSHEQQMFVRMIDAPKRVTTKRVTTKRVTTKRVAGST